MSSSAERLHCEDALQAYAPFISESITASALFEVLSCRISRDATTDARRLHVVEDLQETNLWVACVKGRLDDGLGHALLEEASDDETETFQALYASKDRIVLETVSDGDCGVDVLNLMLGSERRVEARDALRLEMAEFLFRNVGNRALIAMLYDLGELLEHRGRFELATELSLIHI